MNRVVGLRAALLVLCSSMSLGLDWKTFMAPGPMAAAHQDFGGNCDKCHLVFDGIPDERCLSCHEPIAERERAGAGFHGSVVDQDCIACHTDHRGESGGLTRDEAMASFDHDRTRFPLRARHSTQPCTSCHTEALDALDPRCSTCHDDPHGSAFGPECGACHVDLGFAELKTLSAHLLDTDGGHEGLGCIDCHLHGENLSAEVVCADCHDQAHGGTQSDCGMCHEVSGFMPAKFDHGPCTCSFPGKHQTVGCLECHEDFVFVDTPILCSGCHTDDRPHEPLGECSRCHTALSWSEGRFDHDSIAFKITGAHLSVSCDKCHAERFRGVPTACEGCHAEAGALAHGDFGACAPCHETAGFVPSSFDHASVGFPLTGRHSKAPCQSCHAEKVEGYEPR